ncbi:MAG: hypothetical protein DMG57_23615 [Acidobacteria bacterium]|nr:MAG: hypothetical protein DMG57_23615 [Acidobacteriota bacterium]
MGGWTAGNASGQLNSPADVALDSFGTLYLSDRNNDRVLTLAADGTATVVVGTGVPGFNGDGLPGMSTQLQSPGPLFVAPSGTLYFDDNGNEQVVRKVSQGGVVSTVTLVAASGVTADASGNLFISDPVNHQVVRMGLQGFGIVIAGTARRDFRG